MPPPTSAGSKVAVRQMRTPPATVETATMYTVADYDDRLEAFVLGRDRSRVHLATAQLAGSPCTRTARNTGVIEPGALRGSRERSLLVE